MITATLQKSTGQTIILQIPENGREVSLSQGLDFRSEVINLLDWMKDNADKLEEKRWQHVIHLVNCLKSFYGELVDFMELDQSYLSNISNQDMLDHFSLLTEKDNDIQQAYDSLVQIFNLVYRASMCTPVLRTEKYFEFQGVKYVTPGIWQDTLFKRTNFESINVKQAIEVLQAQSNYYAMIKDVPKGDERHVNYLFEMYLRQLSILLIEDGKEIPLDETEFKKHMTKQISIFENIDYQTALDIEHWFNQYFESLKTDGENYYFFHSKEPTSLEEIKAQSQAQHKNEDVIRRIGWKSIAGKLIELQSFLGLRKTALESAMSAPFTDAVKVISIDNSK